MADGWGWSVRQTIVAVGVALAATVSGCDRTSAPVTWTASGFQVTRLEMPLDDGGSSFMAGEYVLEGREDAGCGDRRFRDRMLLTAHDLGTESHVLGYLTRTYGGGERLIFRLYGTARRIGRDPGPMVVIAHAHRLGPAGARHYPFMPRIELRLDPASGRILARGSSRGTTERAHSRTDSSFPQRSQLKERQATPMSPRGSASASPVCTWSG